MLAGGFIFSTAAALSARRLLGTNENLHPIQHRCHCCISGARNPPRSRFNCHQSKQIMTASKYQPAPIDTHAVKLPPRLAQLTEKLAEHTHDVWATKRLEDGWTVGPHRDDKNKKHPSLVPYSELPE